ncbi:MAG: sodium-dependent transporter [Parachlamydiaceae bacterium]|nr:sodium-dependent transporter [Parachlamydiaceae bacterium]
MSNQSESSNWKTQSGYVWSLIGSAVGFANILSFSAQVYKNGGGAFLIPYMLAVLVLGIPMLLLEGFVGYKWKLPVVGAYGLKWNKVGKVLGWLSVLACLTIGGFYIVLTGYSAAFTYFAAVDLIPEDSRAFFIDTFLKTTASLSHFGELSVPIFLGTLVVGFLTWFVLVRQVKDGIERICSIFMPILAVIMAIFAVIVCLLPGGMDGWIYYLKPDFSKLSDANLWRDVFGQLFFSLSLGLGIIIGYSRHTGQKMNIAKAMAWVALGDFAVSFISGAAIFGFLAHISYTQGIPFDSIITSDSTFEIGFVLFPKMLKYFGPILSQIIGTIFFFCIFVAGITGVFSIVESIAGNVEVEFRTTRRTAVTWVIGTLMAISVLFCMGNASHLIDALAPMVLGTNMLIGGLALVIAFGYTKTFRDQMKEWDSSRMSSFFIFALRYIAPVLLGVILLANLITEFQHFDLPKMVRWGWFGIALIGSCLIVYFSNRKQISHNLS